jgi:uncharacterized protein YggT (Ycf19 family)
MGTRFIADILQVYIIILFLRILSTWIPLSPWSPMGKYVRVLALLTDPLLNPIRRVFRPVRVGAGAIDFAPMVLLIALEIIDSRLL